MAVRAGLARPRTAGAGGGDRSGRGASTGGCPRTDRRQASVARRDNSCALMGDGGQSSLGRGHRAAGRAVGLLRTTLSARMRATGAGRGRSSTRRHDGPPDASIGRYGYHGPQRPEDRVSDEIDDGAASLPLPRLDRACSGCRGNTSGVGFGCESTAVTPPFLVHRQTCAPASARHPVAPDRIRSELRIRPRAARVATPIARRRPARTIAGPTMIQSRIRIQMFPSATL